LKTIAIVASSADPFSKLSRSESLAKSWGSTLVNAGAKDHLGSNANLGDWEDGKNLLAEFLKTIN